MMKQKIKYVVRPCVVDVVCRWKNKILLVKRGHEPFKGMWALPGGYVGKESVEDAAMRELQEETGILLYPCTCFDLMGVFSKYNRDPRHTVSVVFSTRICGDCEPKVRAGDDASEAAWFELHALPCLAFDHSSIVEVYVRQY